MSKSKKPAKKSVKAPAPATFPPLGSIQDVLRHGVTLFPAEIWSELYESTDLQMRMAAGAFGRDVCDVLGDRKTPPHSIHNLAAFFGQLARHLRDYGDDVQRAEDANEDEIQALQAVKASKRPSR